MCRQDVKNRVKKFVDTIKGDNTTEFTNNDINGSINENQFNDLTRVADIRI
jgi:hypothetical protein